MVTSTHSAWIARRLRLRPHSAALVMVFAACLIGVPARAQRPTGGGGAPTPPQRSSGPELPTSWEQPVNVLVNVREPTGMPLAGFAMVKLISPRGAFLTASTQDGSTATFPNIMSGEYDVEVTATGYKTANEHASVYANGTDCTVYVYLHPENEAASAIGPARKATMTPKLQAQIDKGLDKLRRKQFDEARAEFLKAAKAAPGNPDIQYLLGMVEYSQEHFDAAREKFQAALALDPSHERSLMAMGELQLREGNSAAAVQTLEKVYQTNGADWRTHFLLGHAYLQQKEYEKALPHATKVVELAKQNAAPGWLLLGQIYAAQNKSDAARRAFETVLQSFPKDAAANNARSELSKLNKADAAAESAKPQPAAPTLPPALPLVPARPWAPPDIDSKEYPTVLDVACSESDLIQRTQRRIQALLGNFEKFVATEHIEHQEVDANGVPGTIRAKDFNYLVLLQHPKPGLTFLEERRDGSENTESFPTSLATLGLVALGVNVFDPNYESGINYKCEGLGSWRGKATWRLRFEQKKEVPSQIRLWRTNRGTYHIPLKGRVWIDATSFDILHVETDLREPVSEIQLNRDHLIVDYGPVRFDRSGTSLWLPWDAEMFLEFRSKRYHHTHALRNYMLFSVDTTNQISQPKETQPEKPEQP